MSDLKKAADILRSLPAGDVTRRQFVTTALAAGFAMAVQPVAAGTLTTDDTGLVAGEIRIPLRDGTMPGYRAMPKDGHGFPIVLVVQEIFGVHEHIKDVSRRLGKLGYLAVAPELYFRQGDVSKLSSIDEIRTKVVSKVPDAQVLSDLDASAAWARSPKSSPRARPIRRRFGAPSRPLCSSRPATCMHRASTGALLQKSSRCGRRHKRSRGREAEWRQVGRRRRVRAGSPSRSTGPCTSERWRRGAF